MVSGSYGRKDQNKTMGNKYDHLKHDPEFRHFLSEMLDERDGRGTNSRGPTDRLDNMAERKGSKGKNTKGMINEIINGHHLNDRSDDQKLSEEDVAQGKMANYSNMVKSPNLVKSPSDTTIYTPGLRRISNEDVSLIEKISNFVESIRLDGKIKCLDLHTK